MSGDRRLSVWFLPVLSAAVLSSGCASYGWRFEYNDAAAAAAKQNKTLFIYYRHWLSADCTRMGNEVLNKPDVAALFQDTVNCELEYDWQPNQETMARYGVQKVPGYLFVGPNGKHVARTGPMNKDQFVQFVRAAKETLGAEKAAKSPATATATKKAEAP